MVNSLHHVSRSSRLRVRVCDSEQLQECFTLAFSPTRCLWGVGVSMNSALKNAEQEVFFAKGNDMFGTWTEGW